MPDLWMEKIIQDIKEKNHEAAKKIMREEHEKKVIAEKAPMFWRAFADFLEKHTREIEDGLHGDITQGELSFALKPENHEITLGKSAFPSVQFTATPQFNDGKVSMNLGKVNPIATKGMSFSQIPCRFEVQSDDTLILQLNGHSYPSPEDAARFIIERAFTL